MEYSGSEKLVDYPLKSTIFDTPLKITPVQAIIWNEKKKSSSVEYTRNSTVLPVRKTLFDLI